MLFSANVDVRDLNKLWYKWSVTAGTIEDGLGKPHIVVRTAREDQGTVITAIVEISGLPAGCANSAKADGEVNGGHPPEFGELEVLSGKRMRSQLDAVVKEFSTFPVSLHLYVLSYNAAGEKESSITRRETVVKDYLSKAHRIAAERIIFVRGGKRSRYMRFYGVPPAARVNS